MSKDEQAIESEIQAKGLNAPRLSPERSVLLLSVKTITSSQERR